MLTNWLVVAKDAVVALNRIADALEAMAMTDRMPINDERVRIAGVNIIDPATSPRVTPEEFMEAKANGARVR